MEGRSSLSIAHRLSVRNLYTRHGQEANGMVYRPSDLLTCGFLLRPPITPWGQHSLAFV